MGGGTQLRHGAGGRHRTIVLARLDGRADEITAAMLGSLRQEVAAGRAPGRRRSSEQIRDLGRWYVRLAVEALADDGELDDEALAGLRAVGSARAREGVPLAQLLHGYQVAVRVLWRFVLDEVEQLEADSATSAALLSRLSPGVLRLTSQVSATVSGAYTEASQRSTRTRERARHEVWDQLLSGAAGSSALLCRRAASVGIQLGELHQVAVVALDRSADDTVEGEQLRVEDALSGLTVPGAGGEAGIVCRRDETHVAVYPLPEGTDGAGTGPLLERALRARGVDPAIHVAAVGSVERGVEGVARSHRQALRTLQVARLTGCTGRVLAYEKSLPSLLLAESPELCTDLWRATVGPLARWDDQRGSRLVATVRALLDTQGNRVEAARRLHVHRHTLTARLRRIEQLCGCSLDDGEQVLLLALGLRAHGLLAHGDEVASATHP